MLQEAMSLSQLKKTSKKCPRCQMGIEKNGSAQTYHLTFALRKETPFVPFRCNLVLMLCWQTFKSICDKLRPLMSLMG